jgi:cyclopropane-fatty-acyl-phospholipid synthase
MNTTVTTGHQPYSHHLADAGATALDRWALGRIQALVAPAPIRFRLWDGFERGPDAEAVATIEFHSRRALYAWIWDADLQFGETYMSGAVDIRGDLEALLETIYRRTSAPSAWRRWQRPNTPAAARSNVHRHYDLGNDFYKLWLDQDLVYTCAYFPSPDASLEEAQHAKFDLVCRKLQLKPGERVVEAGCGWGALALHMARHYGVTVQAFNVSSEQIAFARERARAERLDDRVAFIEGDYREVSGRHDVFVSVGMLEHVGLAEFGAFSRVLDRALTPDGRGLLHFIGRNRPAPLNPWIQKRIFPGAYPPTLHEVCGRILEPANLSVLDVENLRLHYALTLRHWRARFESAADRVRAMFDEPFVRAWRLYLAGSQAAFATGWMQLFQIVVARASSNAIPWTRTSG